MEVLLGIEIFLKRLFVVNIFLIFHYTYLLI